MTRRCLSVIALFLFVAGSLFAQGSVVKTEISPGLSAELTLNVSPNPGIWTADKSSDHQFTSDQGYGLHFYTVNEKGTTRIQMELNHKGEPFQVLSYGIRFQVSRSSLSGIWYSQNPSRRSLFLSPAHTDFNCISTANAGIPLVICTNKQGGTLAAVGWLDQILATRCISRSGDDLDKISIELTKTADADTPLTRDTLRDSLFIRSTSQNWYETAREYSHTSDFLAEFHSSPIPQGVDAPYYSTWYAYGDRINTDIVWNNAVKAKELGFGTIQIAQGWDTPSGGSWGDPDGPYGDFEPRKDKFQDLAALIERIHNELGLRVELWTAPIQVGYQSQAEANLKSSKIITQKGEDFSLCPRQIATQMRLTQIYTKLFKNYKLDGVLIDGLDRLPVNCISSHGHIGESMGAEFTKCADEIRQAVMAGNPKASIEYLMPSANLNNKNYCNLFSTHDASLDPEYNRLRGISLRAYSQGISLRSDPAFWRSQDSDLLVARSCAVQIFNGIPGFSLNLSNLKDSHAEILKAWIQFYLKYKEDLLTGTCHPFGSDQNAPNLLLEGSKYAYIYLKSPETESAPILQSDLKSVILFNDTGKEDVSLVLAKFIPAKKIVSVFDSSFKPVTSGSMKNGNQLSVKIPLGGVAILE